MSNSADIPKYTKAEVIDVLLHMKVIFEVARLVDVSMTFQLDISEDGTDLVETAYSCYAVWNMEHRCKNCISAIAYQTKGKGTKFEFVDNEIYYVVSKYVEVEGVPYMLEMVTKLDDDVLFGAYGKAEFIETIIGYNNTLYTDELTKAYNRHYFESQLMNVNRVKAIAMIDVDHFKGVNDTYGHEAGDVVLKEVAACFLSHVRSSDSVVRYGGDEFLILFGNMRQDNLYEKMESIRVAIENLRFENYPDIRTSISVGAVICEKCDKESMKRADDLVYKAKQTRNRVCV